MAELKLKFRAKRQQALACRLPPAAFSPSAFTLVEMLVVLAILGILAALTVPALKNFGHSDAMTAADQQMVGAVARARQLAMSQRTTVYMVFVPTNFWNLPCNYGNRNYGNLLDGIGAISSTSVRQTAMDAVTNVCGDQLTGYNFVAYGAMGDQPGRHQWHYLDRWQALPDGTFFAQQKFVPPPKPPSAPSPGSPHFYIPAYNATIPIYGFTTNAIPFPTADSPLALLPCIAFNYLGQLTYDGQTLANRHAYIPLARGYVSPAIDPKTRMYLVSSLAPPADAPRVLERPPGNSTNAYNIINIDPLTGRATLEIPKVQ